MGWLRLLSLPPGPAEGPGRGGPLRLPAAPGAGQETRSGRPHSPCGRLAALHAHLPLDRPVRPPRAAEPFRAPARGGEQLRRRPPAPRVRARRRKGRGCAAPAQCAARAGWPSADCGGGCGLEGDNRRRRKLRRRVAGTSALVGRGAGRRSTMATTVSTQRGPVRLRADGGRAFPSGRGRRCGSVASGALGEARRRAPGEPGGGGGVRSPSGGGPHRGGSPGRRSPHAREFPRVEEAPPGSVRRTGGVSCALWPPR